MAPTVTACVVALYPVPRFLFPGRLSARVLDGGEGSNCRLLPFQDVPVRPVLRRGMGKLPPRLYQYRAASDGGNGGQGGFGGSGNGGGSGGGGDNYDGGKERGKRDSWASWYLKAMEEHPVLTKSLTTAFLNLAGDLICQLLINRVSVLDLKRLLVTTFLGFVLVGPTLHFWYYSLSVMVTLPGTSGTLLRLFLDQFFFSPVFIGAFLSSLVTLEGRPSQVVPRLKQEWFSAVLANWQLWIPFQFLNFQFVPQQFQVLAANVIAVAWNVILSFISHKEILAK